MSSIIKSLSDVVSSLVELVWSFFTTAADLVQETVGFVLKFATEILDLFVNFFKGLVDLAGGIVGFVLGKSHPEAAVARSQSQRLTIGRQCPHAWCPGCSHLWFLAVSAQPGQYREGWQQEVKLAPPYIAAQSLRGTMRSDFLLLSRLNLYDTL
jgi:hypothetical protein